MFSRVESIKCLYTHSTFIHTTTAVTEARTLQCVACCIVCRYLSAQLTVEWVMCKEEEEVGLAVEVESISFVSVAVNQSLSQSVSQSVELDKCEF